MQIREEELEKFMKAPFEEFAWATGRQLTGLTFRVKADSFLLIVKANGRLDGAKVAFIETPTFIGCLAYLATYCYRKNVPLRWANDRYA